MLLLLLLLLAFIWPQMKEKGISEYPVVSIPRKCVGKKGRKEQSGYIMLKDREIILCQTQNLVAHYLPYELTSLVDNT